MKIATVKAGSNQPPVLRDATPEEAEAILSGQETDPPARDLGAEIDALRAALVGKNVVTEQEIAAKRAR